MPHRSTSSRSRWGRLCRHPVAEHEHWPDVGLGHARHTQIGGGPVSTNPGPAWQAIGTGDFNQDGFSDILLQNKNTGAVSVWEMDDNTQIGGGPVADPGLNWHAIGTGQAVQTS
jgi:hypothetical protein